MRASNGTLVRLEDVARIELGAEDYDSTSWYKGKPAIFIGVEQAPGANPLSVAQRVREGDAVERATPAPLAPAVLVEGLELVESYGIPADDGTGTISSVDASTIIDSGVAATKVIDAVMAQSSRSITDLLYEHRRTLKQRNAILGNREWGMGNREYGEG